VDQVVEHVDAVQRLPQLRTVVEAALDHFDVLQPRHPGDLRRRADQDLHPVPGLQQPGDQPAADVPGGASHQHGFRVRSLGGAVHGWLLLVGDISQRL
jgi:hypothetical protein